MAGNLRSVRVLAAFLGVVIILGTLGSLSVDAKGRYNPRRHSEAKGAVIGAAAGAAAGALVGGRKGAVIVAGAGAGTGYLVQRHRNKRHFRRWYRRHHRRYDWRR